MQTLQFFGDTDRNDREKKTGKGGKENGNLTLFCHRDLFQNALFCLNCKDDIFSYGQICNNSFRFTVIRKKSHSKMHGINRIFHLNFLAFYFQSTSLGAVSTVNSTCQFASSASKKSGKTDNLSFVDIKVKWFDGSCMA